MKNLILVRHAKSSWETPLKDRDRPLSKNGLQAAHLVSSYVSKYLPKTYLFWTSVAERASQTALIFAQNLSYPIESIIYKEELYTFDENQLAKVIKSCKNEFDSVILFGHNGAITNFVNKFGDVFIENVPTSGFVSLQFDVDDWSAIEKGKTLKVIVPKDLK
ncbi:Histidine phosphatase family protein [Flavobacterium sp. 9R]|jgi:phosphohistidine phosphatase|uniref:SixA phosphatase family protein n=1 Tax=unclassified Flavobacterium TaxID=196869 RepID=UPI0012F24A82|nr:histidine phosphatase family protein [Flavobacterium sp. 9R]VXB98388.1 Histidine phosphatase family protein [Flavobacterium sp. 9R]